MKKNYFRYLFGLIGLLMLACGDSDTSWVARVGNQKLRTEILVRRFRLSRDFKTATSFTEQQLQTFIDQNFADGLILQAEGHALGIAADSLVQVELKREHKRLLLRPNGAFISKILPPDLPVTEAEINDFYEHSKKEIQISHIIVKSGQEADSLSRLLAKGADFGELAQKNSLDLDTGSRGGKLADFLSWGRMLPELEQVAFNLKPKQISAPIKTEFGYHIIKLEAIKEPALKDLPREKETMLARVKHRKMQLFVKDYIQNLFTKYQVTMHPELAPVIKSAYRGVVPNVVIAQHLIPAEQLKQVVMTYQGGQWTVQDFINHYNRAPIPNRIPIKSKMEFEDFIRREIESDLMLAEALAQKVDQTPEIQDEYNYLQNKIIERHTRNRLLKTDVTVSDEELKTYYEQVKTQYSNQSFEDLQNFLRLQLRNQKVKALTDEIMVQLNKKYKLKYNAAGLKSAITALDEIKKASPAKPPVADSTRGR
ncbi:peptidylprolyl isomerase [candidate division KSB1 bacterium]|nr:peptidylprolyl isomerase [candidate division KSB1 bacterium]